MWYESVQHGVYRLIVLFDSFIVYTPEIYHELTPAGTVLDASDPKQVWYKSSTPQ